MDRGTPGSVTLKLRPNGAWQGFRAGQFVKLAVEIDGAWRTPLLLAGLGGGPRPRARADGAARIPRASSPTTWPRPPVPAWSWASRRPTAISSFPTSDPTGSS